MIDRVRRLMRCGVVLVLLGYFLMSTWISMIAPSAPFCRPHQAATGTRMSCAYDRPFASLVLVAAGFTVVAMVWTGRRCLRHLGGAAVIVVWSR
jgi:hypothetical protein